MPSIQKPHAKALAIGSAIAIASTLIGLFTYKPMECPAGYTQQQVDASGCYVGATIGPSWLWPVAIGLLIELLALFVTAALYFIVRKRDKA